MTRPAEPGPPGARADRAGSDRRRTHLLYRFTRGERWVHRATAGLMLICIATAAILYLGPLSVAVGRRRMVADIHIYTGIALPLPMLAGWLRRSFRRDARLLNRFSRDDWRWLASRTRRDGRIPVGKFNAGQKLNAAFTVGAIVVMLGTGSVMRFANGWPVGYRTGATFVHDWLAYGIAAVLIGHLYFAGKDPAARGGMRTGWVPRGWARREHAAWVRDLDAAAEGDASGADTVTAARSTGTGTGDPRATFPRQPGPSVLGRRPGGEAQPTEG